MERNEKFKKFGDKTSKGNEKKKNYVHKKKLGSSAALMYESPLFSPIHQARKDRVTVRYQ